MKEKEDRRVKYTKALLRDGLVELMQENHISKISVTNLCQVADVHRSTFYSHYKDQYDLLRQLQEEVLSNVGQHMNRQEVNETLPVTEQKLISILEYGKKNSELISVLLSDNSDDMFQKRIMEFVDLIPIPKNEGVSPRVREYIVLFGVSGTIEVIKRWLNNGAKESTKTLAHLIMQLTQYGMHNYMQ